MQQLKEGMQVYCDLHSKAKVYTIVSLSLSDQGWAVVKGDDGKEFRWPTDSCFPVKTKNDEYFLQKHDYRLYRRYPSGCDILIGVFTNKDAALSYKRKLEEKNPLSQYHIREL